jgi:threonine/homoserine/homoserine lactone efflux protein
MTENVIALIAATLVLVSIPGPNVALLQIRLTRRRQAELPCH